MKKNKIITISILGLLFLVPFAMISPVRAQVPSYVGVAVDDKFEWDNNIYLGAQNETWEQWFADNMTEHWSLPFDHIANWVDMSGVYGVAAGKIGPTIPQYRYHINVTNIEEMTGYAEVNASVATEEPINFLVVVLGIKSIIIGENATEFAEDCWYGGMATSVWWATDNYGWTGSNGMLLAPSTIDWADFATACNTGLETMYAVSANYSFTLTVAETLTGFTMTSPVMGFGNNSEIITLTFSYNAEGVLIYHTFEYGSDLLYDVILSDIDDPLINSPADFAVEHDYTGVTINWTGTDASPDRYGILRNLSIVGTPTLWQSGVEIQFAVPDGLAVGDHLFKITLSDYSDNTMFDEVLMTVSPEPTTPTPDGIPGYEPVLFIGISASAILGIILRKKKKK